MFSELSQLIIQTLISNLSHNELKEACEMCVQH